MLNTRVLDGRRISQEIQQELRPRIDALRAKCRAPTLAVAGGYLDGIGVPACVAAATRAAAALVTSRVAR